jgi:hypothetical protein
VIRLRGGDEVYRRYMQCVDSAGVKAESKSRYRHDPAVGLSDELRIGCELFDELELVVSSSGFRICFVHVSGIHGTMQSLVVYVWNRNMGIGIGGKDAETWQSSTVYVALLQQLRAG